MYHIILKKRWEDVEIKSDFFWEYRIPIYGIVALHVITSYLPNDWNVFLQKKSKEITDVKGFLTQAPLRVIVEELPIMDDKDNSEYEVYIHLESRNNELYIDRINGYVSLKLVRKIEKYRESMLNIFVGYENDGNSLNYAKRVLQDLRNRGISNAFLAKSGNLLYVRIPGKGNEFSLRETYDQDKATLYDDKLYQQRKLSYLTNVFPLMEIVPT